MRLKLHHPLWVHLPAGACLVAMAAILASADMPDRVPVHFGADGLADRWGSPLVHWFGLVGFPLAMVIGSAILDEIAARQETRRLFNWLTLIDEALVGVFLALAIRTVPQFMEPEPRLEHVWPLAFVLSIGSMALAALLEAYRVAYSPPPAPPQVPTPPTGALPPLHGQWVYWEIQNPVALRIVIALTVIMICVGGVVSAPHAPILLPVLGISAVALALMYGGMRVIVTNQMLRVRFGVLGIPLARIRLADIRSIEAMDFSPLTDFGGWGIRYSLRRRMWGYFLAGRRGVRIETIKGRNILLGSDTPDRLAAVCQAAAAAKTEFTLQGEASSHGSQPPPRAL